MNITPVEMEALHATFHRLEQRWNVLPIPNGDRWHSYDPLPFWEFLAGIRTAQGLTDGRTFLDLGSGVGTKLSIMQTLGWTAAGIERHRPYVLASNELIPEAAVRNADILDCDRFDADLVYLYRPAITDKLEDVVEAHVIANVTPGTVLFFPTRRDPPVWVA